MQAMEGLLARLFSLTVKPGSLRFDSGNALALNSIRARFQTDDGRHLFLKCHHEQDESERVGEYYKAGILEEAGFPVDLPIHQSSRVGEQMVIYPYRDRERSPELHTVARQLEQAGCQDSAMQPVVQAFDRFQLLLGERYLATLHMASPDQIANEAVHGLYHRRLVDSEKDESPGARIREYYQGQDLRLPGGITMAFEKFQMLRWCINGRALPMTLHESLHRARRLLMPTPSEPMAAVTAHGDDHTGNLLYLTPDAGLPNIMYFDPAFAGHHVPALLAPCKALYHICHAHPDMLYDPDDLRVDLSLHIEGDTLHVEHDWQLSPLRSQFLDSQRRHVWIPLLRAMSRDNSLPAHWAALVDSALLCCPLLCKNLRAGAGSPNPLTPTASLLTFAIAMDLANGLFTESLSH